MLVLHFHLMPVPATFHASVVPQSLAEFFPHGGLQVIDVPFALGTDDGVAEYAHRAASSVETLTDDYVHVIVILTDHTSDDTGDLFLGLDETGCMAAGIVDEVSPIFLKIPTLIDIVQRFWSFCSRHSVSSSKDQYYTLLPAVRWSKIRRASSHCAALFPSKYFCIMVAPVF